MVIWELVEGKEISDYVSLNKLFIYKLSFFIVFYHANRKSTNIPLLLSNISKDVHTILGIYFRRIWFGKVKVI